jgi:hypothetical protein
MSALRISRPGIAGTTLIDLGPDRPHRPKGSVPGGVLVVGGRMQRTVDQARAAAIVKHRDEVRARQEAAREAARPKCGRWIIVSRAECARKPKHAGSCTSAARLAKLAEMRRSA